MEIIHINKNKVRVLQHNAHNYFFFEHIFFSLISNV